ncbi:MAG: ATP-binding protein [Planctomycetes bacterium]|nr:ATP-binding protein [Planctomycetota bacterium]
MDQHDLSTGSLPPSTADNVQAMNPHWRGQRGPQVPAFHRTLFPKLLQQLQTGLTPGVVLRGPRRVGKTVLVRQLIDRLLADGVNPNRILYIAFDELPTLTRLDEPVLQVARWFEARILGKPFNEVAAEKQPAFLLFDEVQNLADWAAQLKSLVDNHSVRVLVTGSSSLRIDAGKDSIAGRVQTLNLGPLNLREIAELRDGHRTRPHWIDNGMGELADVEFWREGVAAAARDSSARRLAFRHYSERGGYPIAQERADAPWPEIASYLNETVIQRAIQHDLRIGARGRKRDENLLEEVFRLACRYTGQSPGQSAFVPELQRSLDANIGYTRILTYLKFLDGTLLLKLIRPLELRLKKQKSPAKICVCDHALRASWLQELIPLDPEALSQNMHLSDLAGRIAEGVLGYFLAMVPNLEVSHFPERGGDPEVDFVLTIGTRRIPIEVKYRRRIDPVADTRGLVAFLERSVHNAEFGLLVTMDDNVALRDPRILPISLSSLLWQR